MANLQSAVVSRLLTELKKKPRAADESTGTYIDSGSNLQQIQHSRHAVIFGRRGSGKTTLLAELKKIARSGGDGIVWIDIDDYKSLTYPDVLIQVLRALFESLLRDVRRKNRFYRLIRYAKTRRLKHRLSAELSFLKDLLNQFEESDAEVERASGSKSSTTHDATIGVSKYVKATKGSSRSTEASDDVRHTYSGRDRKIDHIRRHLQDAKSLIRDARQSTYSRYFLILDDFYHLTVDDQARVLDYLQSLAKNNELFIKFGTIAHRSSLYHRGESLIEGMQKEHDVLSIDLDRTFQNFQEVEEFIERFWGQIKVAADDDGALDGIFGGDSRRQLVLATGGVPRDFMNILARSLELGQSHKKEKLDVLTINEAANLYLRETKHPDLVSDKVHETNELEGMLSDIRDFCVKDRKRNIFLIDKDDLDAHPHQRELLRQLLDFRFIHLVHSNTSASSHAGRFEAYMLDVGLYAHPQRRGDNRVKQVDFFAREDQHRQDAIRTQPIYRLKEDYAVATDDVFAEPVLDSDSQDPEATLENLGDRDAQGQYLLPY